MVEQRINIDSILDQLGTNLAANLPAYRRTTPQEWSKEMQKAAFGADALPITENKYQQLITRVRKIRLWLKEHGKPNKEHPAYVGTNHPIFWVKDIFDSTEIGLSVELKPWEQQSWKKQRALSKV